MYSCLQDIIKFIIMNICIIIFIIKKIIVETIFRCMVQSL